MVQVCKADIALALTTLGSHPSGRSGAERVHSWLLEPAAARLGHLAELAGQAARKLGKPPPLVDLEHGEMRLCPERWGPIWSNLVHVVRTAVYHGIETPEQREERGKPASGQIWLLAGLRGADVVLEVRDDGRGIPSKRVAEKARARDLPHGTPEELQRAMFSDGFSTADQGHTDISGRGVGLAAMLQACEQLGGRLEMDSSDGAGSCFRFVIPVASPDEVWTPVVHGDLEAQTG